MSNTTTTTTPAPVPNSTPAPASGNQKANFVKAIETDIHNVLGKISKVFKSGAATRALQIAGSMVTVAMPIVQSLDQLAPNKTVEEVQKILATYAKEEPEIETLSKLAEVNPGSALLQVASLLLKKELPPTSANVATNVLNTAVQLAVTALHASS